MTTLYLTGRTLIILYSTVKAVCINLGRENSRAFILGKGIPFMSSRRPHITQFPTLPNAAFSSWRNSLLGNTAVVNFICQNSILSNYWIRNNIKTMLLLLSIIKPLFFKWTHLYSPEHQTVFTITFGKFSWKWKEWANSYITKIIQSQKYHVCIFFSQCSPPLITHRQIIFFKRE